MEITGAACFTFLAFGVVPVLRADRGGLDYLAAYGDFAVMMPYEDIFQVCRVPAPEFKWHNNDYDGVLLDERKSNMKFILLLRLQGLARYK